jgi:hypothetical protein
MFKQSRRGLELAAGLVWVRSSAQLWGVCSEEEEWRVLEDLLPAVLRGLVNTGGEEGYINSANSSGMAWNQDE